MSNEITNPFDSYRATSGAALDLGKLYVGVANLDPQTNPIAVFYDEALTIAAPQPIPTSGGYIWRNGAPARIFSSETEYSIKLLDKNNLQVFYVPVVGVAQESQAGVEGAVGDGVTDDTAAIAAAILATPSSGTLYFPTGSYKVAGSGNEIFTITTPINILGAGSSINGGVGTTFLLNTGVPTTRDLFHIVGVTNAALRGYTFKNFNVGIVSSFGGKNVFHFDSTAGTTTGFAEVVIDNVMMPDVVSAGGNSVFVDNGIGTNTNGGTFNFTVRNSFIGAGVAFQKAGDTLRVLDNIITGATAGIISDQVAGAGQLIVSGNNMTSAGGMIIVANGVAPVITGNQLEQLVTNTETNNAMIDLTGSVGNISNAKIVGNQVQNLIGTATPIRVAAATGTVIDNNRLGTPSAYAHIVNTAAATSTVIGSGNTFIGGGANITDATATTIYAPLSKGTQLAVLGNSSALNVNPPADIVASNINQVLRVDGAGGALGFGQVQLAGGATSGVTGILPAANGGTGISSLGTGVATALGVNVGTAGSPVVNGGALGTPSSGVGTNLTALNATQLTSGTIPAARTNGHQNGTATNDNAAAGEVGELITATQGSAQALTTNVALSITSISLTAGDWDVSGTISFSYGGGAGTVSTLVTSISLTTNTLDATLGRLNSFNFGTSGLAITGGFTMDAPVTRVSVSSTTSVFLVGQSGFGGATTATGTGIIRARRVR